MKSNLFSSLLIYLSIYLSVYLSLGAVVGMVVITPASGYILPGYSILFGFVGAIISFGLIRIKKYSRIDDSLDVFFCHGVGKSNDSALLRIFDLILNS